MANIQEIFIRINETKKKVKDLKSAYKDALDSSLEYKEINDKIKTLRAKKQQIEGSVKSSFASELTKLDDYAIDMASDNELLSDAALTKLMKGETVEVTDEYDNKYEPLFSVKFKKT